MKNKIPQRKKAIQTRQRLLEATLEQISLNGYHNVTVDKIAAAAGVSTGSAYRYFKNKKEMLLATIEYYYENIQDFSNTQDFELEQFNNIEDMLTYVLEQFYYLHQKYYGIHEELESLRHIDTDIKNAYHHILLRAIDSLIKKCPPQYAAIPDFRERLYIGIGILENYSHTRLEIFSEEFDMEQMKNICIQTVENILFPVS